MKKQEYDLLTILVRIMGSTDLILKFFAFISQLYNTRAFYLYTYLLIFNKKANVNLKDFFFGRSLESIVGKKKFKKVCQ